MMDPAQFFSSTRLVIMAGKGGVGKTTVTAVFARAAALAGLSVLVLDVDGKSGLPAMFGREDLEELTDEETVLSAGGTGGAADVRARTITPHTALVEYLKEHGMSRISRLLAASGALDILATAVPGLEDILVLGKAKQLEQSATADLMVLDAPAAGHALKFLHSARGLVDTVRVGPINSQAREVLDLLDDHRRCQVVLVALAEETPVNETIEAAYALEDQVGVSLGPVVVNGLYSEVGALDRDPSEVGAAVGVTLRADERRNLANAASFRRQRIDLQREQVQRLQEQLPLPQLHLPFRFTSALGPTDVDELAARLLSEIIALDRLPHGA